MSAHLNEGLQCIGENVVSNGSQGSRGQGLQTSSRLFSRPSKNLSTSMRRNQSRVLLPDKLFAAVEAGGTTFRVAIARGEPTNIIDKIVIKTTTPEETLGQACDWLRKSVSNWGPYHAIGVASFGPVCLDRGHENYGKITSTPKQAWKYCNILQPILDASPPGIPFEFETDVNAPAYGEFTLGGLRNDGLTSCAYITVGTGVGVGLVINGQCVHGLMHPEAGHCPIPTREGDNFISPSVGSLRHGAEANACAGAIAKRAGVQAQDLAKLEDDNKAFDEAAYYLANLCVHLILVASPERIILSGGVMKRTSLFPKIRREVQNILKGYVDHEWLTTDAIENYICPSVFLDDAGMIGTLCIAQMAELREQQERVLGVPASAPADSRPDAARYGFLEGVPQGASEQQLANLKKEFHAQVSQDLRSAFEQHNTSKSGSISREEFEEIKRNTEDMKRSILMLAGAIVFVGLLLSRPK